MSSITKEKLLDKTGEIIFDDSSLPEVSKAISAKRAKSLEKTLGVALLSKFNAEFNLQAYKK